MSNKIYTTTLKTILRSPSTWISFFAILVLYLQIVMKEPAAATTLNYHKCLAGYASSVLELAVPIFISVISSVSILNDRNKRFKDIVCTSGVSQPKYYCIKICAYVSLGLATSFLLSYVLFFIRFFQYDCLRDIDYSLLECLWQLALRWLAYSIAVLPVYISIAVCFASLFNSPTVGITISVAYAFARYLPINSLRVSGYFLYDYIYHLPKKITDYFYFFHTRARPEAIIYTELSEVILAYLILLSISVTFFSIGYIMYKKRG